MFLSLTLILFGIICAVVGRHGPQFGLVTIGFLYAGFGLAGAIRKGGIGRVADDSLRLTCYYAVTALALLLIAISSSTRQARS
jgi:hypothetical protein